MPRPIPRPPSAARCCWGAPCRCSNQAARDLAANLKRLAVVRAAIADAQERHRVEGRALDQEQARLGELIARKSQLQQRAQQGAEESNQRIAKLAGEATTLKELIEKLDAERKRREAEAAARAAAEAKARAAAEAKAAADAKAAAAAAEAQRRRALRRPSRWRQPSLEWRQPVRARPRSRSRRRHRCRPTPPSRAKIRGFREARGNFLVPASGRLVAASARRTADGAVAKGMTYETRPGAQVVAPFDGRVLFAGPFRGYGQILIIEHGDGYHSLVAGLATLSRAASDNGWWPASRSAPCREARKTPSLYRAAPQRPADQPLAVAGDFE